MAIRKMNMTKAPVGDAATTPPHITTKVAPPPSPLDRYRTFAGIPLAEAMRELDMELESAAYKKITGGKGQTLGLTDIKPQYLYATLNRLFGPFGLGWKYSMPESAVEPVEFIKAGTSEKRTEWQARCVVVPSYTVLVTTANNTEVAMTFEMGPMTGGSTNSQAEWAMKGAIANALGAAWSFAGWQESVYMDKRNPKAESDDDDDLDQRPRSERKPTSRKPDPPKKTERSAPPPEAEHSAEWGTPFEERPTGNTPYGDGRKGDETVLTFSFHKGKRFGDLPDTQLRGLVKWAETQGGKYDEEAKAIVEYLDHGDLPF